MAIPRAGHRQRRDTIQTRVQIASAIRASGVLGRELERDDRLLNAVHHGIEDEGLIGEFLAEGDGRGSEVAEICGVV